MMVRKLSFFIVVCCALTFPTVVAEKLPANVWADRDILSAQLSRNGTYVGLLKAFKESDDAPKIEIFRVSNMELVHRQLADPMRIQAFNWINDTKFVMFLTQQIRRRIEGFNQGVYGSRVVVVDIEKKKESSFSVEAPPTLVHMLPDDPDKIIVAMRDDRRRPRGIFELDLADGSKKLIIREQIAIGNINVDSEGNPITASGFDRNAKAQLYLYRPKGTATWIEYFRRPIDDFDFFSYVDEDAEVPGNFLVLANNGHDKIGLWSYDPQSKSFGELIYRRNDVDILGPIYHSNSWTHPDTVVGFRIYKGEYTNEYWDQTEQAIYEQLAGAIKNVGRLGYTRSYDGNTFLILNSGPKEPPTYYLLHEGKLDTIGSTYPRIRAEDVGERQFITWKARDGRTIPGLLTLPVDATPPYPLVVVPHGGPYVAEISNFHPWVGALSNQGYAVLQPQYRGSYNYGLDHYLSAFRPKSEAGFAMQDDKDDGAIYLVKTGMVDEDRIAMFGWSYGGYAALVASMREPQIYQCAIAGAAVSDPLMQVNYYRDRIIGRQREEQLTTWLGAFSPFENLKDVNVPLLLIHGNNDQRVPLTHANKVVRGLEANKVPHKYVEIEGIDHFSSTMHYSHRHTLWSEIFGYLENDCGPDGL